MTEAAQKAVRRLGCLLAAAGSGALTAAGYAPWESLSAPWLALVPLLLLARFRPPRESFGWGFAAGLVNWLVSLSWLLALRVTAAIPLPVIVLGWIALSAYCALYTGLFAWAVSHWFRRAGVESLWRNLLGVLFIPVVWTGLEYARGVLFTGFPWNPLGATLATNAALSQAAELGGVYLLSGLVALINASLAFTVIRYAEWKRLRTNRPMLELSLGLVALAAGTLWGRGRYIQYASQTGNALIGLVQPAVAQNEKWDEAFVDEVQETLDRLTEEAVSLGSLVTRSRPDLVIWPETSTPRDVGDPAYRAHLEALARRHGPVLLGSILKDGDGSTFNSALLLDREGRLAGRYDKQHLVPFGEFLPFDKSFPALQNLSPLGVSLTAGREPVVLRIPGKDIPFSVTICFEDIFPRLSRRFVREGARLLVNQSNDAWFDGTAQHRQHLNLSILRCIENRVPGVRVSNSGASGFIEANGRVYRTGLSTAEEGWLGATGPLPDGEALSDVALVRIPPAGPGRATLYTRWGDAVWAIPCAAATAAWIALSLWLERKRKEGEPA